MRLSADICAEKIKYNRGVPKNKELKLKSTEKLIPVGDLGRVNREIEGLDVFLRIEGFEQQVAKS